MTCRTIDEVLSESDVPVPAPFVGYRRFLLDGALLLFDRDTGTNVLCDGPETEHLRQVAPSPSSLASPTSAT